MLDEFHIQKYIRRMARLGDVGTEESREKAEKNLQEWIEGGNRKKLEEWTDCACESLSENMLELVKWQKEEKPKEKQEEEKYFSASEILSWERKHRKING